MTPKALAKFRASYDEAVNEYARAETDAARAKAGNKLRAIYARMNPNPEGHDND